MRQTLKENGTWELRKGKNHPYYGKSHSENARKKISKGNRRNSPFDKKEAINVIKKYHEQNLIRKDLAKEYNVSEQTISRIINCRHWTTEDLKMA